MNPNPAPLSKFVSVDVSPARVARLWASVSTRVGSGPFHQRRYLLAVVAAVGLLVGAGAGFWVAARPRPVASTSLGATLQTASDRFTVDLEDGARLELASHTNVRVLPSDARTFAIRLHQGTVVCDLAPGTKRQFAIFTADLEVRDTGTRFSVTRNADADQVEVSVERGSVVIIGSSGLEAGKSLSAGERWFRQGKQASTHSSSAPGVEPTASPATARASSNTDAGLVVGAGSGSATTTIEGAMPGTVELPNAASLFEQGSAARREGNSAAAARAYQTLLARFPNDSRAGLAALELGRLRMGPLSDVPGAIRAFQTALSRTPGAGFREDALAHLIAAHAASGNVAQCRSFRETYLKDYPKGVHAALVERQCGSK